MSYISLGKFNKKYKYILLASLFGFLVNIIFGYYDDNLKPIIIRNNNKNELYKHVIIHYFTRYLGLFLLSFFLFRFERKKIYNEPVRQDENENNPNPGRIQYIYNDKKEEVTISASPLYVGFILVSMVSQNILEDLFYRTHYKYFDFWVIELFILSHLYNCLLNYKICLHHKNVLYLYIIVGCVYKIALLVFESSKLSDEGNGNDNDNEEDETKITRIWLISGILFYFLL